jgi:hypothetical protein
MSAAEIVKLRDGKWHGTYGMIRCPAHDDRNPSCRVWDDGGQTWVHCYAGCDWRVVRNALKLGKDAPVHEDRRGNRQGNNHGRIDAARAIWRKAELAENTVVASYLKARGINYIPPTIRFAELIHRPSGRTLPTMVAAIQNVDGEITAIHRTYLDGPAKASVKPNRMMLGGSAGAAVRFHKAGERLAIGEGIETCLSVVQEVPDLPVWAALSTSGLKTIIIPNTVQEVIILADNDGPGELAASVAASRLMREGRTVKIARPLRKDFNEDLMHPSPNVVRMPRRAAHV